MIFRCFEVIGYLPRNHSLNKFKTHYSVLGGDKWYFSINLFMYLVLAHNASLPISIKGQCNTPIQTGIFMICSRELHPNSEITRIRKYEVEIAIVEVETVLKHKEIR